MKPLQNYTISEEQRKQYAGVYLLSVIINTPQYFPVLLEGHDKDLEPVLEWLMMKGYLEIEKDARYIPTEKGREVLSRFMGRYIDFLKVFDIYSAVDLEKGEFGFARYFYFSDDESFKNYLENDRWDDLRLAVCAFKGLDPVEIVFMSFLNEKRFGKDSAGWQFDLLLGSVWDEVLEVCNTAIYKDDLAYEDDYGPVTGEAVMKDIISQGAELNIDLKKIEAEKYDKDDEGSGENLEDGEEYVVDPVIIEDYPVDYYYAYRDPFYISPVWMALWLL